jgi:hypothetical protein
VDVFEIGVAVETLFEELEQLAAFLVAEAVFAEGGFDVAAEFWPRANRC